MTDGRTRQNLQFISFSRDHWTPVWLNRHHIMSRISQRFPVLFCSRRPTPRELLGNLFLHNLPKPGLRRVSSNLIEIVPPRWMPQLATPLFDRVVQKLHALSVRHTAGGVGPGTRVLYLWHPQFAPMVGRFGESLVIFHCYDDYLGTPTMPARQRHRIARLQEQLARRADLVFAAGETMRNLLPGDIPVHTIANAVDFQSHERVRAAGSPPPDEFKAIPRPILAHIGRIEWKVDFALLTELARRRRDWSFVVIGPHEGLLRPQDGVPYSAMCAEPNIYRVGFVPPHELARYVIGADVCLMAYREAGCVPHISPLKLFEYLAGGRPIVASDIPELRRYPDYVNLACTPDEWIAAIEHALATDSESLARKRIALAAQNSWNGRCERILELIDSKLEALGKGGHR
jgi:glycosyltransferase involved in cell wall biosynthesis